MSSGQTTEDYSLNLTKKTGAQWSKLAFGGTPAFSDSVIYHGYPEGTLFQLDDEGNRTGKTGEMCIRDRYRIWNNKKSTFFAF